MPEAYRIRGPTASKSRWRRGAKAEGEVETAIVKINYFLLLILRNFDFSGSGCHPSVCLVEQRSEWLLRACTTSPEKKGTGDTGDSELFSDWPTTENNVPGIVPGQNCAPLCRFLLFGAYAVHELNSPMDHVERGTWTRHWQHRGICVMNSGIRRCHRCFPARFTRYTHCHNHQVPHKNGSGRSRVAVVLGKKECQRRRQIAVDRNRKNQPFQSTLEGADCTTSTACCCN